MPLPANGAPWPPPTVAGELAAMREWGAWYSGDPDQLSDVYSNKAAGGAVRPSQRSGGVAGALARWWWGTPVSSGEKRAKLHVPIAADIAGASADLLFAERPTFTTGNKELGARFDDLVDEGLVATLHEGAEVASALSGCYLRTAWDASVAELPWLTVAHPDQAVPRFRWGKLAEVSFWTRLAPVNHNDRIVHRLVEHHQPGAILYALYQGREDNIGTVVPLQEHPEAEHLAGVVDSEGGVATNVDRLTASYVPNMRPNRRMRHSPQGRSDFQGVEPMLDALDEAYSSWWRDIRHAKSRLIVPETYLRSTDGPGSAAIADVDRELMVPVRMMGRNDGDLQVEAQQFAIRYSEHAQTCRDWTNQIIRSAGYSVRTLGEVEGGGAVTATEVRSQERRSYTTTGKKARYWKPQLIDQVRTLIEVGNANLRANIPVDDFAVELGDPIKESTQALAQTAKSLRDAEAASTETVVRMTHPSWDNDQVDEEVARIAQENRVPDPLAIEG